MTGDPLKDGPSGRSDRRGRRDVTETYVGPEGVSVGVVQSAQWVPDGVVSGQDGAVGRLGSSTVSGTEQEVVSVPRNRTSSKSSPPYPVLYGGGTRSVPGTPFRQTIIG